MVLAINIIDNTLLKIKSVALHRVRIPLREPFRISNGEVSEKDAVLVEVITADGIHGWGEASPMSGSFYSEDTPDSVWQALSETLVPHVLDQSAVSAPKFYLSLRDVPGEPFAKAGLEGALWDAHAQTAGVPLCELLGGDSRPLPSGVAVGIYDSLDELLDRIGRFVADGYRRVKIKIKQGWDVEPVAAIRERFPTAPLMVDANAAYSLADAQVFRELDRFGLMMIEQPLAREAHDEAAQLQRLIRTPICADESAESLEALEEIIDAGAARIINIKLQRVGGLSEARLMLERVRKAGLGCWVGTMPELGIASAQALHFAVLDGFTHPTDVEASARWYTDDVIEPAIEIDHDGFIHLPAGPGSGFKISREKVERYAVRSESYSI